MLGSSVYPSRGVIDFQPMGSAQVDDKGAISPVVPYFDHTSYYITYNLPVTITRGSNNIGPYQYPEKVVPLFTSNAIDGEPLPVYGDGRQMREYQYVIDHCEAIDLVLHEGTIGDIYTLANELDIPVRTIQNFEHLLETIEEFDEKGARGYVGSCCEAFYNKHHRDFLDTKVPGLLIDVDDSTCYELGEEQEAYVGTFEGQTVLKLELLVRLLTALKEKGRLEGKVAADAEV